MYLLCLIVIVKIAFTPSYPRKQNRYFQGKVHNVRKPTNYVVGKLRYNFQVCTLNHNTNIRIRYFAKSNIYFILNECVNIFVFAILITLFDSNNMSNQSYLEYFLKCKLIKFFGFQPKFLCCSCNGNCQNHLAAFFHLI